MYDLSSLTRDQTYIPALEGQVGATRFREVLG